MTQPHFITVKGFGMPGPVLQRCLNSVILMEVAITIQLSAEVETRLRAQAGQAGLPVEAYVRRLIDQVPEVSTRPESEENLAGRLAPILARLDWLPRLDSGHIDEVIGYDDVGLPLR